MVVGSMLNATKFYIFVFTVRLLLLKLVVSIRLVWVRIRQWYYPSNVVSMYVAHFVETFASIEYNDVAVTLPLP